MLSHGRGVTAQLHADALLSFNRLNIELEVNLFVLTLLDFLIAILGNWREGSDRLKPVTWMKAAKWRKYAVRDASPTAIKYSQGYKWSSAIFVLEMAIRVIKAIWLNYMAVLAESTTARLTGSCQTSFLSSFVSIWILTMLSSASCSTRTPGLPFQGWPAACWPVAHPPVSPSVCLVAQARYNPGIFEHNLNLSTRASTY